MGASWTRNRLTARLGIDYPVIQGPLGGLSSHRLTAAVSNFGALGSFGAHSLAPEAIHDAIGQLCTRHRRHGEVDIDAVQQGAGDPAQVALYGDRVAAAGVRRIAGVATGTPEQTLV